jgi:hypothetical protein
MAKQIVIDHPAVSAYVAEQARAAFTPGFDHSIGIIDAEKADMVRGGVIITGCTGSSCIGHVAGRNEHWLNRDMIWVVFHYVFVQLGCARLLGIVEAANTHTLRFDLNFGFKELYRIERMFPSGDGIIVAMDREECRWLKIKPRTVRSMQEEVSHGR